MEIIGVHGLVVCNNLTGQVLELHLRSLSFLEYVASNPTTPHAAYIFSGKINPYLINLKRVRYLDLSNNDFGGIPIPQFLGFMRSLRYLNLYGAGFSGMLDFSSQTPLKLANNKFQGPIPSGLQNVTSSVRELDLSSNEINSSIPHWFYSFSRLDFLDLGGNFLKGEISNAIDNMTSLMHLDLSTYNQLELVGGIPGTFRNFCNLRSFFLSYVKLNQSISEIFEILSGCALPELDSLVLDNCQLFGHLTDHLGQFKNLLPLSLSDNMISGPIPFSLGELHSLRAIDVSHNKLNGTLPISFGGLRSLVSAYFSYNSMEGDVSETHFANLTNLDMFFASGNKLTLRVSPGWVPSFQLVEEIGLGSWQIGPQFPMWLHSLRVTAELKIAKNTAIIAKKS
ncbi:probable leucine-rich repeat receptor-like protein kinase At1g35710 [Hevea brasiliensis]|uniref:probable leucine-rich repeat receptor-like protein kinase At1g35710 n=1 Tax=Hevea brasiliensis TaxID=3981 RepID=UPI0025FAC44D|nr:probable leucine-rich repeat receptor-like protein kinase At1g35710 [Hevea brasiliensis]